MSLPSPTRQASSASRSSSSARTRTGATTPIRPKADPSLTDTDVLEAFMGQFYEDRQPPKLVLLSHEPSDRAVIEEALTSRLGSRVYVEIPQRGEKRDLVNHALNNAREALGRQLAEGATQKTLLEGVAELFGLDEPPRRIEVYDNSHISGTNAVGAMIVAGEEGLSKKHYRTFNIRSTDITPGDDFGMMREVLTRRFSRLANESDPEAEDENTGMPDWPDVVFIDGGQGQLNAVRDVIGGLDLPREVTFIGIAKGEERDAGREKFFMEGKDRLHAAAPRPGALLRAAAARRSAPLRHWHAPRQAARRISSRTRSTKSTASARRASARCCSISARPKP